MVEFPVFLKWNKPSLPKTSKTSFLEKKLFSSTTGETNNTFCSKKAIESKILPTKNLLAPNISKSYRFHLILTSAPSFDLISVSESSQFGVGFSGGGVAGEIQKTG